MKFPATLGRGFGGMDVDGGGIDFEMEEPFAGDGAAVLFGGRKSPELRGLEGAVGEKLTGATGVKGGLDYGAGFVDLDFYRDADGAANRVAGGLRGVGQNLLEDFALDDAGGGSGIRSRNWRGRGR